MQRIRLNPQIYPVGLERGLATWCHELAAQQVNLPRGNPSSPSEATQINYVLAVHVH